VLHEVQAISSEVAEERRGKEREPWVHGTTARSSKQPAAPAPSATDTMGLNLGPVAAAAAAAQAGLQSMEDAATIAASRAGAAAAAAGERIGSAAKSLGEGVSSVAQSMRHGVQEIEKMATVSQPAGSSTRGAASGKLIPKNGFGVLLLYQKYLII